MWDATHDRSEYDVCDENMNEYDPTMGLLDSIRTFHQASRVTSADGKKKIFTKLIVSNSGSE